MPCSHSTTEIEGREFPGCIQPVKGLEQRIMEQAAQKEVVVGSALNRAGKLVDKYGQLLSLLGWETDESDP